MDGRIQFRFRDGEGAKWLTIVNHLQCDVTIISHDAHVDLMALVVRIAILDNIGEDLFQYELYVVGSFLGQSGFRMQRIDTAMYFGQFGQGVFYFVFKMHGISPLDETVV